MLDYPQPDPAQVAQRLRMIDVHLEQLYPGYLAALEHLRQNRTCVQEGKWNDTLEQRHAWKGRNHEQH